MNIAINATILDDKPTGLGIYTLNVVNEIAKLVKIYVITSHTTPFETNPNIKIIKTPEIVQPKNKKKGAIARLLWLNLFLPRLLKKNKIDLLINLTHHGLLFSRIPQIVTIHDLIPIKFASQYTFQSYYYRLLLPILIRKAIAINTCSEFIKKEIINRYKVNRKKIFVSGNSFNPLMKNHISIDEAEKDYVLMVGATYNHKNFHLVLKAYEKSEILKKYKLKIVGGKDNYLNYLKSLARKLHLQDKIEFIEYADHEYLSELYRNAKVFVYPSLYEGFGMPPLEAMWMGTPVVASRIESIKETCENSVCYFDPNSIVNIKEKLEFILGDETPKNELVRKGFEQIKKHTWSNVAKKIYDFVISQEIIDNGYRSYEGIKEGKLIS